MREAAFISLFGRAAHDAGVLFIKIPDPSREEFLAQRRASRRPFDGILVGPKVFAAIEVKVVPPGRQAILAPHQRGYLQWIAKCGHGAWVVVRRELGPHSPRKGEVYMIDIDTFVRHTKGVGVPHRLLPLIGQRFHLRDFTPMLHPNRSSKEVVANGG